MPLTSQERFKRTFLLLLVALISGVFFVMVRGFLVALLLAVLVLSSLTLRGLLSVTMRPTGIAGRGKLQWRPNPMSS